MGLRWTLSALNASGMAVVYVGDYDPAGLQIADTLETKQDRALGQCRRVLQHGCARALTFERVAVTEQQIIDHGLAYQAGQGHTVIGSGMTLTKLLRLRPCHRRCYGRSCRRL